MKNVHYKANLILGLSALGFIISYPFHSHFIGGLLSSGFIASLIGGCADWFAITALFRKPLGIGIKTEIILRNRDRIFESLAGMMENELLSKAIIEKKLLAFNSVEFLIQYIALQNTKISLLNVFKMIIGQFVNNLDSKHIAAKLNEMIQDHFTRLDPASYLAYTVDLCIHNGYDEKAMEFAADEAIKLLNHKQMNFFLESLISGAKKSYESDNRKRQISNAVLLNAVFKLSDKEVANSLRLQLINYLEGCKNPNHPVGSRIKAWLLEKAEQLKCESQDRQDVEKWIQENLLNRVNLETLLEAQIKNLFENEELKDQIISGGANFAYSHIQIWAEELQGNSSKKEKLDGQIKEFLLKWVDDNHHLLRKIVLDNLNKLPNHKFVELIESKVGNELQMVRINGSVVGGLAGMLLYMLTFWI